jgi:hypothetical protein
MPTLLIRDGRNPYEVCVSVGIIVITIYAVLVGGSPSASVQESLSYSQRVIWSLLCFVGAVVTLAGLYWPRDHMTGLLIERAGQVMLMFAVTAYLVALCTVSTFDRSGLVMTIGCSIVVSAAVRAVKISRGVRRIRSGKSGGPVA